MAEDVKDKRDGQVSIDAMMANIRTRLAELYNRRQRLMEEIIPVDAAIKELESLVSMGNNVTDMAVVNANKEVQRTFQVPDGMDIAQFRPVRQPTTVQKQPIQGTRTGPSESPPVVKDQLYVASPKSKQAVATNMAVLKQALGR